MKKRKRGRPPKDAHQLHSEKFLILLEPTEKQGFKDAAELAGMPLSVWMRERLRRIAAKELETAKRPIAFRQS